MNNLPNPLKQVNTIGIVNEPMFKDHLGDLWVAVVEEFKKQPPDTIDGGNDKHFFSFTFNTIKIFVAENEVNGLTVMLPNEY